VFGVPAEIEPRAVVFYKVTCPVCQMAAPAIERLAQAYPGRVFGVGQDPPAKLAAFGSTYGLTLPTTEDPPPYPASRAYGIRVVPTVVLVEAGSVADVVESWDRDRLNSLSRRLAESLGLENRPVSEPGDGLPVFRPG
jgi:hypothetical protein